MSLSFLGVDLAASSSAWCLLNDTTWLVAQGDSWGMDDGVFVQTLLDRMDQDTYMIVEDLPHHIPYRVQVKDVLRLHGRILDGAEKAGCGDRVVFVDPAAWQRSYEGVFRKGPVGAASVALSRGYQPPDLSADPRFALTGLKGRERARRRDGAKKLLTDYVDAFLIASFALGTYLRSGHLVHPGLSLPRKGPTFR